MSDIHEMIASKDSLERCALRFGLLPFFAHHIAGFSVEEMAAPGMLFGGNGGEDGCWEWKGPVIREQTTAYGKFFNRKAGFVALDLLPDFLNYRRKAYPVVPGSMESHLLDTVTGNEGLTSTELKRIVYGTASKRRRPDGLADFLDAPRPKRHSLEGPLQRLQMGGRLLIADFEYKLTAKGERYGWGVALYSTPEIWFDNPRIASTRRSPEESLAFLVDHLRRELPHTGRQAIERLLR